MEIQLKPFTFSDWQSYPGCEGEAKIAELELPLDGKTLMCDVVVDDNGINLDYIDGDVTHDFQFPMNGTGVARAEIVLGILVLTNPNVTVDILKSLGFIYNKI